MRRYRKVTGAISVFFLTVFLWIGCQHLALFQKGEAYPTALAHWTREARLYEGFELRLAVAATYQSAGFREAYASAYASAYRLDGAEIRKLKTEQAEVLRDHYEFLVAAYVPDRQLNDLDRPDSVWRIYLTVGGNRRLQPTAVQKVKQRDPKIEHFFPFVTPWKSVYRIRFKKNGANPAAAPDLDLEITGVAGSLHLKWKRAE